jgi:glycine/D-amino acid oxidase-like deaminating enzyme
MTDQNDSGISNPSWWHVTSGIDAPPPLDSLPESATVAVVGGGVMGASVAWSLAERGLAPVVLERERLASGASGRNGGLVVAGAHSEYVELAQQLGEEPARELIIGILDGVRRMQAFLRGRGLEQAWSTCGYLAYWTAEEDSRVFVESAAPMNGLGWPTSVLDRAGCEQALGTRLGRHVLGGVFTASDMVVQPATLTRALAAAALDRGASLLYGTGVQAVEPAGRGLRVRTPRGVLEADHVVLATNVNTDALLPAMAGWFRVHRGTVAVTEPVVHPLQAGWAEDSVAPYGRPLADGRLLFGGFARRGLSAAGVHEPAIDGATLQPSLDHLLATTFPDLLGARIAHTWAGTLASTPDRLPMVGPWPGLPRLWLLAGFGGQGLPYALWAPRLLANAIAEGTAAELPEYLLPARFLSD